MPMSAYTLRDGKNSPEEVDVAVQINIKIGDGLLKLIDEKAGLMPRNEYMAKLIAEKLGRPELGIIPRKPLGRKRRSLLA